MPRIGQWGNMNSGAPSAKILTARAICMWLRRRVLACQSGRKRRGAGPHTLRHSSPGWGRRLATRRRIHEVRLYTVAQLHVKSLSQVLSYGYFRLQALSRDALANTDLFAAARCLALFSQRGANRRLCATVITENDIKHQKGTSKNRRFPPPRKSDSRFSYSERGRLAWDSLASSI
jgi:hypothetical protein